MRGNHNARNLEQELRRSIPARAGEPLRGGTRRCCSRVYPRACGGTFLRSFTPVPSTGLSPRVRGNPHRDRGQEARQGSIPARAGEPRRSGAGLGSIWVYPRACGGTAGCGRRTYHSSGLSPRVRGNQLHRQRRALYQGSIPARAGEPSSRRCSRRCGRVYPRACGGTRFDLTTHSWRMGLSPRVRGNRDSQGDRRGRLGSIPARAGEPRRADQRANHHRVYPRACGGTAYDEAEELTNSGLSPRVRGNRLPCCRTVPGWGSIPARAGEPPGGRLITAIAGVYPRACGGTASAAWSFPSIEGLSPRVRGNQIQIRVAGRVHGSIPARAGEPNSWRPLDAKSWVYPRACGGTGRRRIALESALGLSPRVRGNPIICRYPVHRRWSIPARAGEP